MMQHVVVGGGPLGRGTAAALVEKGDPVHIIDRGGAMDITDTAADADVIYHCANAAYQRWLEALPPLWVAIRSAAELSRARLVIGTNIYALGAAPGVPFDHISPMQQCSSRGRTGARLEQEALHVCAAGRVVVQLVRNSDLYGPNARDTVVGDCFFGRIVVGRPATYYGRRDVTHTCLPDFCHTMAAVGTTDVPLGSPG